MIVFVFVADFTTEKIYFKTPFVQVTFWALGRLFTLSFFRLRLLLSSAWLSPGQRPDPLPSCPSDPLTDPDCELLG